MTPMPRAFRSVLLILTIWTGGRLATAFWPEPRVPEEAVPKQPSLLAEAPRRAAPVPIPNETLVPGGQGAAPRARIRSARSLRPQMAMLTHSLPSRAPADGFPSTTVPLSPPRTTEPPLGLGKTKHADKWSASSWILYRGSAGSSTLAPAGQLGGGQGGARIWRNLGDINDAWSIGSGVRVSSALRGNAQREVAPGIGIRRSGKFPFELVAERRFAVDGNGRDRFALLAAGGFDDLAFPGGIKVSGYAQTGLVGLKRRDGFVDGAVRAEREIIPAVRLGIGAWGAAQPSLWRLDIGPSLSLRTEALQQPFRIAVEWRQRVAGNARPGSGPALTVGTDF